MKSIILLLTLYALRAHALDLRVTTPYDSVAIDGFCSLREAIDAVNNLQSVNDCPAGDNDTTVHVPPGYYPMAIDPINWYNPIVITRGVHIIGAGPYVTTIDGLNIGTDVFSIESVGTAKVIIEGMTITGGGIAHHSGTRIAVRNLACYNVGDVCFWSSPHPPRLARNATIYMEDVHMLNSNSGIFTTTPLHLNRTVIEHNALGIVATDRVFVENSTIIGNIEGDCTLSVPKRFKWLNSLLGNGCQR